MELKDDFFEENTKRISLDFAQLRDKGLSHIQQLSGDIWTDYNAHDPGVTILEQLCYALTDIAYRTSLPIQYFLAPFPDGAFDEEANKNAFFTPSTILSTQPVTKDDIRKAVINEFESIENVWLTLESTEGYQEQLRGIYTIEILPKQHFRNVFRNVVDSQAKSGENELQNQVMAYLRKIRNLGEDFSDVHILKNQNITIDFDIYLTNEVEIEKTIADLIIALFDFIYHPVHHYSFEEMQGSGYSVGEIFAGPKLDKGFIKNEELRAKRTIIYTDELEKLFLRVKGVHKCKVKRIKNDSGDYTTELKIGEGKFFNIFYKNSENTLSEPFDAIFNEMRVFTIKNTDSTTVLSPEDKGLDLNRELVRSLFEETWSKHHREYNLRSQDDFFSKKLKGYHKEINEYHSIQNHFPMIYGIGKEKLPKGEASKSIERKAQALQLKAYLLFFEKHLANHLSQLGNMNEFFNISFKREFRKTYFTQKLDNVPEIVDLLRKNEDDSSSEAENVFFRRKHRIYDHLLARFGEDLNELPWKIKHNEQFDGEDLSELSWKDKHKKRLKREKEFNIELLSEKSKFLKTLGGLNGAFHKSNYSGIKGEDFSNPQRIASGLEQLLMAKTGIPPRMKRKKMLSEDKDREGLFIVDHILLRNIIDEPKEERGDKDEPKEKPGDKRERDIKYGFSFRDQDGKPHFETDAKESWCNSAEDRIERIKTFFRVGMVEKNYIPKAINGYTTINKCDLVEYDIDRHKQDINKEISALEKELGGVAKNKRFEVLKKKLQVKLNNYRAKYFDNPFDSEFRKKINELIDDLEEQIESLTPSERTVQILKSYIAEFLENSNSLDPEYEKEHRENLQRKIVASYDRKDGKEAELRQFFRDTRSYIQLFNDKKNTYPRVRLEELEEKRKKGSYNKVNQKRLVFQRKVNLKEVTDLDINDDELNKEFEIIDNKYLVIDEDFFDLNISILFPNTPRRFTDERFKTYVTDLIGERTPAHIANDILWLNITDMMTFEAVYNDWEELNFKNEKDADNLIKAAFKVYRIIRKFRKEKLKQEKEKELRQAALNTN